MLCDVIPEGLCESREPARLAAGSVGFVPSFPGRFPDVFDFLPRLAACDRDGLGEQFRVRAAKPASGKESAKR
jgi:hypothetical protein